MAKANAALTLFYNTLDSCSNPPISSISPFATTAIFSIYEDGAVLSAVDDGCRGRPVLTGTLVEEVDLSGVLPLFLSSAGIKYDYPALVLTTPTIGYITFSAVVNGATVEFSWYQVYNPADPWPPEPPVVDVPIYMSIANIAEIYDSVDGTTWTGSTIPTGVVTPSTSMLVESFGGKIFNVSSNATGAVSSDQGATWDPIVIGVSISRQAHAMAYSGGAWLLFYGFEFVYRSVDGINFSQISGTSGINWYAAAVNGSEIVAGTNNGAVGRSTDAGLTWTTAIDTGIGAFSDIQHVLRLSATYCAFTSSGIALCATSPTGEVGTWTTHVIPSAAGVYAAAYSGSRILCVLADGDVIYSDDEGVTWNAGTATDPPSFGIQASNRMIYANDLFMYTTFIGGPRNIVNTTPDGITWTQVYNENNGGNTTNSMCSLKE